MPRDSAAARAAAAAAPPPPPPPAPAGGGAAPKAGGAAPKAPIKPQAAGGTAPKKPTAPAAPKAPVAPAAPQVQPIPGESSFSTAARELAPRESELRRRAREEDTARADRVVRMREYEQRLARVRDMRAGGAGARVAPTTGTKFTVTPREGEKAQTIAENAPTLGSSLSTMFERSRPETSAPLNDTPEFARQAERLGERYTQHVRALADLDALRQQYEDKKKSGYIPEDAALRQKLSTEEIPVYTTPTRAEAAQGARPGVRIRKRTPEEVDAVLSGGPSGPEAKLREIAQQTRTTNQELARTISDLKQYGFENEADVARSFPVK